MEKDISKKRLQILAWQIGKLSIVFVFGIAMPLLSFYLSTMLGEHSIFSGKLLERNLIFLPLAIWASIAFFTVQLPNRTKIRQAELYGIWIGLYVSIYCFVLGFFALGKGMFAAVQIVNPESSSDGINLAGRLFVLALALAPWYTPIWYYRVLHKIKSGALEIPERVHPLRPLVLFVAFLILAVLAASFYKDSWII